MWTIKEEKISGSICVHFYYNMLHQYSIMTYENGRSVILNPEGHHIEKIPEIRR